MDLRTKLAGILFSVLLCLVVSGAARAEERAEKAGTSGGNVSDTNGADVTQGDFLKGAKLWKTTCARCHNMRDARDLRDDQWDVSVAHMRVRAGLTGQDARDIAAFLKASND